jgi:DNA adenine methylase
MVLRRLGNKKKIAKKIQAHFPRHRIFVETFFGAGGMFFEKPKAEFNIVNDIDSDVCNLFQVVINQKEELKAAFNMMPIHKDLLEYWKLNQESDSLKKALRFLLLSNFTFLGKMDTLSFTAVDKPKKLFNDNIELTFKMLEGVKFNNCDFRRFLKSISFPKKDFGKPSKQKDDVFIYNDSPYLGTVNTYSVKNTWSEEDCFDLFEENERIKCKYAISEFDHPFVLQQAKERNLNVIEIGERQNLKNRRTEILVTNYKTSQLQLDF